MYWKVPKIWEGGDVWIIGGGPSIPKLFGVPDEIVHKVLNGELTESAYSPYMSAIHGKHVVGVNAAFLLGDWVDVVFFGDSKFFLKFKDDLLTFDKLRVSCAQAAFKENWIRSLRRDKKHGKGISTDPTAVSWNGNSGCAAVSMAVNMGVKRVFLLGFDMKLDESNAQHWHSRYKKARTSKNMAERKNLPFRKHLPAFPAIARDAQRLGVEIYNVSPDSVIEDLPKISLEKALEMTGGSNKERVDKAAKWAQKRLQYFPNILQPRSFNEKVLHKKLFDRNPLIPLTLDKVYVKKWVFEKLWDMKYIIPNLWVGKGVPPDNILQEDCIVKPNHMSGQYMIIRNGVYDKNLLTEKINKWLSSTWGQDRDEWGYKDIEPTIIVEPLLKENEEEAIAYDWKFHVFNGKCKFFYVDKGRETEIERSCYTTEWERLDVTITGRKQGKEIKKPNNFNEMLKVAEKLGKGFDFVRVDLYNVNGNIYFSEMTHYPASGSGWIEPVEFDYKFGGMWK